MPLVDGDKVILIPGGREGDLAAVNKKTGELIWQSKELADSIHYSSPIVAEIGGVRQYIQLTDASVAGIAADDGRVLWRAAAQGRTAVIPTPIFHDGFVYVTSGYGAGCNLFKVAAADSNFSAEPRSYANKIMGNHHGGCVLVGEHLYGYSDGKGWTCQDFKTGKAVWQEKKLGKGSLVYADGMLYLRARRHEGDRGAHRGHAQGLSRKGPLRSTRDRSDNKSWAHPVVTGGRLYLRDQDELFCYDVKDHSATASK